MAAIWRKHKTLIVAVIVGLTSLGAGVVLANRVAILNIQGLAGNRAFVTDPHLEIVNTKWAIDAPNSTVTGLDILVFPNDTKLELRLYQILVQVSCLNATGTEYICATGAASTLLPSMNAGIRPLHIGLRTPVFPELTEIHDLSFIVTSTNRIPMQNPVVFVGAVPSSSVVTVEAGKTSQVQLIVNGFLGVPQKTVVGISLKLPTGFHALIGTCDPSSNPCPYTLGVSPDPHITTATATLSLTADPTGMVGFAEGTLSVTGTISLPAVQITLFDQSEVLIQKEMVP